MNSTRLRSERNGTSSKRPAIAIESAMREIAPFAKSKFRVANPIYGHTLAPNFAGEDASEFVKILVVMNSQTSARITLPIPSTTFRALPTCSGRAGKGPL